MASAKFRGSASSGHSFALHELNPYDLDAPGVGRHLIFHDDHVTATALNELRDATFRSEFLTTWISVIAAIQHDCDAEAKALAFREQDEVGISRKGAAASKKETKLTIMSYQFPRALMIYLFRFAAPWSAPSQALLLSTIYDRRNKHVCDWMRSCIKPGDLARLVSGLVDRDIKISYAAAERLFLVNDPSHCVGVASHGEMTFSCHHRALFSEAHMRAHPEATQIRERVRDGEMCRFCADYFVSWLRACGFNWPAIVAHPKLANDVRAYMIARAMEVEKVPAVAAYGYLKLAKFKAPLLAKFESGHADGDDIARSVFGVTPLRPMRFGNRPTNREYLLATSYSFASYFLTLPSITAADKLKAEAESTRSYGNWEIFGEVKKRIDTQRRIARFWRIMWSIGPDCASRVVELMTNDSRAITYSQATLMMVLFAEAADAQLTLRLPR